MTIRQEKILSATVKEYTQNAKPVASSALVRKYGFSLSSATIRAEMAQLEEDGFLCQPHTSAGRIPTDKGYRYFIDRLMEAHSLARGDEKLIQKELIKLKAKHNQLIKTTARLLSAMSSNLGMSSILDLDLFHEAGMNKLIAEPEFSDSENFTQITETLDWFDENIESLFKSLSAKIPQVYIGKENPLTKTLPDKRPNYSMVVAGFRFPSGEKGLVAIIGPKRMRYGRNISLVRYVTKLLGGGMMILVIFNFQAF